MELWEGDGYGYMRGKWQRKKGRERESEGIRIYKKKRARAGCNS